MSGDSVTTLQRQFKAALDDGDLRSATEQALAIESANPSPAETVQQFATAIEGEDDEQADTLLRKATERFDAVEASEERRRARSNLARSTKEDELTGSEQRRLTRHNRQVAGAALRRSDFLAAAGSFLHGNQGGTKNRRDVVNTSKRAYVQEQTATRAAEDGTAITNALTLPARAKLLALQADSLELVASRTTAVRAVVGNVGDARASNVRLVVDTPNGLAVEQSTVEIGVIDGGKETTVEFEVTGESTGLQVLPVTLRTASGREDHDQLQFQVREEAATLAAAVDRNGNHRIDTPEIQRALSHWANDEPIPDSGGRTLGTEDVRQLIVSWANDQPV